jgi:hypothetical protein
MGSKAVGGRNRGFVSVSDSVGGLLQKSRMTSVSLVADGKSSLRTIESLLRLISEAIFLRDPQHELTVTVCSTSLPCDFAIPQHSHWRLPLPTVLEYESVRIIIADHDLKPLSVLHQEVHSNPRYSLDRHLNHRHCTLTSLGLCSVTPKCE